LTAFARFAMTSAVSAARDVRRLERLLERPARHSVSDFLDDTDVRHPDSGNAVRLSQAVRDRLELEAVIRSLVDDVLRPLGILVFGAHFRDPQVDAFSLFSGATGALIVVNRDSPRVENPLGLRAALAHEICHLLFDRKKMRELSAFCEMDQAEHSRWPANLEPVERRARAFQAELIAPQSLVLEQWRELGSPPVARAIPALSKHFGLGPIAVGWQLRNAGGPPYAGENMVVSGAGPWPEWSEVFPPCDSPEVPEMRRGAVVALVREGVQSERISGSLGRELLRVGVAEWERLETRWTSS
jgi:Zn-dependent peptidase ImmA (M78 family)